LEWFGASEEGPGDSKFDEPNHSQVDTSAAVSERTAARAGAMRALDGFRSGFHPDGTVPKEIHWRLIPQEGIGRGLPRLIIELRVEAWVPAEDVHGLYELVQREVLAEMSAPKTAPRTFKVAQFVWSQEAFEGTKSRWAILLQQWRERYPDEDNFSDWRAFRLCFKRGEAATPPRYKQRFEDIAMEAKRRKRARELYESGVTWFGRVPPRVD
jgi:hypothetical protein